MTEEIVTEIVWVGGPPNRCIRCLEVAPVKECTFIEPAPGRALVVRGYICAECAADDAVWRLEEEIERLRGELYTRPGSKQDWIDRYYGAEARIKAALALHKRTKAGSLWVCDACTCYGECVEEWPCPTVKALKGEGE